MELGIVKNNQLLLSKFRFSRSSAFQLVSPAHDTLAVKITNSPEDISLYKITVAGNNQGAQTAIADPIRELKFALLDVVPGG
ncbi:MAG: hypothetical protein ABW019_03550, partial [Chitinophagaceae bacterium]